VPVYFDTDGSTPAAGGTLNFYITGTSTAKNVYTDSTLGTAQGSTITLDSSGRPSVDFWGDGEYRVTLKNSSGTTIWTRDNVRDVATGGLALPTPEDGKYVTSDGVSFLMGSIIQCPDPTGQAGKVVGSDGVNSLYQSLASLNIATATSTTSRLVIGDWQVLGGSGTAPASGTTSTSLAVTFSNAFTSAPYVTVTPVGTQAGGPPVTYLNATPATTGFTAYFDIAEGSASGANFSATQAFTWIAVGSIA
jgi:hypothetical protein